MFNRSQIFNIIRLAGIGIFAMAWEPVRAEPIYLLSDNSGRIEIPESEDNPFHIEIQAGGILSKGNITDNQTDVISSTMYGVSGRVLLRISDSILLGVSAEKLKTADLQKVFLSSIERKVFSGMLKWIVTPQIQPQVYLLGSMGYVWEETKFILYQPAMRTQGLTLGLGLGIQGKLWKELGVAAEYIISKDVHPWDNFVLKGPPYREELSGYLFYRF